MVNESLTPRIDLRSYLRGEWAGNGCVGDCSSVCQRIGPILGRGGGGFHNPTAIRISNVMLEAGNLFQANRYMVFERWRSATEVPSQINHSPRWRRSRRR